MLEPIVELIEKAETLEEIDKKLFKTVKKMKSDKFEKSLTDSKTNAQFFGIATGKQR